MNIRPRTRTTAGQPRRYYHQDDTIESAIAKAATLGLAVVFPAPNQLFVDIDDEDSMDVFAENIRRLNNVSYTVAPSPSGTPGHYHITVTVPEAVSSLERIALQAMLGSDPTREILSWQRLRRGISDPTLFFERPDPRETETQKIAAGVVPLKKRVAAGGAR